MERYIAPRCPICRRKFAHIRLSTGEGVCHICGVISKEDIEKQKEENKAK